MFCASISHNGSGGVPGDRGAPLFLSRRAHLLTTRAAGGGMASGQRALCEADCALCGERQPILPGLRSQSSLAVRRDRYAVPFACENLPPAALSQRQGESKKIALLSLCRKEKQKKRIEEVKTIGNLSFGSEGRQPRHRPFRLRSLGLYELLRYL